MSVYSLLGVCYFMEIFGITGIDVLYLQTNEHACPLTRALVKRVDFEAKLSLF